MKVPPGKLRLVGRPCAVTGLVVLLALAAAGGTVAVRTLQQHRKHAEQVALGDLHAAKGNLAHAFLYYQMAHFIRPSPEGRQRLAEVRAAAAESEGLPILSVARFTAVITDNRAFAGHRHGYNGVASLVPAGQLESVFVQDWAGLNYEGISMAGLPFVAAHFFEPRTSAMTIGSSREGWAELSQAATDVAGLAARISWSVEEPHYLHQRVEITPWSRFAPPEDPQGLHLLFASYIRQPADPHVYLKLDWRSGDDLGNWFGVTKESHHSETMEWRALPEGEELTPLRHLEAMASERLLGLGEVRTALPDPALVDDHMRVRNLPFYYGMLPGDLVFLMMFKQPERVALAYSPTGGGHGNPAWDYVLWSAHAEVGETVAWELCLVVKPWAGRRDVLREVRRYLQAR